METTVTNAVVEFILRQTSSWRRVDVEVDMIERLGFRRCIECGWYRWIIRRRCAGCGA